MIRRLRVRGYKSMVDATVDFDRLTVVFGPNGVGKSNLLDLISLLSRLATRETIRDAFEHHRGLPLEAFHAPLGFGARGMEQQVHAKELQFRIECDLELHPDVVATVNQGLAERESMAGAEASYTRVTETRLRYELEIGFRPTSGVLRVVDEHLFALKSDWTPKDSRTAFVERQELAGGRTRFVARVERQSHPRYFETDRPRTLLSELSDPVYHPHVVAAAREMASWRVYYVEPSQMRKNVGVQSADEPGRQGELLSAYYYTLQASRPGTFRGIVKNLRALVAGLADLRVDVRDGFLELIAVQTNGAEYPARLLSEGTLRLMCLVGIAVAPRPPAVVVYEEPENGVNPLRLDVIVSMLRQASLDRRDGTQFIVTTHSPKLCWSLSEHLVACDWAPDAGTTFARFTLDRHSMYFEPELSRAIDGSDPQGG